MPQLPEADARSVERSSLLDRILAPLDPDQFFAEWYDKKFLRVAGHAGKFADLPCLSEFQALLSRGVPWRSRRQPEMYWHGDRVPSNEVHFSFIDMDGLEAVQPRTKRVQSLLDAGATIACYGMHTFCPALNDLCIALGRELNAETEAHLFYSQKGCQGLGVHYDCTDVFVLQLVGEKIWSVSEQRALNPIAGLGEPEEHDETAPQHRIRLGPGDLLYLPRGTFHQALTVSDSSLHASAVAKVPTNWDYLSFLMLQAIRSSAMRDYFRAFDRSKRGESVQRSVATLLQVLSEIASDGQALAEFEAEVRRKSNLIGPKLLDCGG